MAIINNLISARDYSGTNYGLRKTGLTPSWIFFKRVSDLADITQPSFTEVGQGIYKFSYDPEVNGEAVGQIDLGSALANPGDRYIDVNLTLDSSRIQLGISTTGAVSLGGVQTVLLDMTQPIPTGNTAQTVGDALNASRAGGFGKWVLTGTSLALYGGDNSTIVKTFTLDSATAPTSRS